MDTDVKSRVVQADVMNINYSRIAHRCRGVQLLEETGLSCFNIGCCTAGLVVLPADHRIVWTMNSEVVSLCKRRHKICGIANHDHI